MASLTINFPRCKWSIHSTADSTNCKCISLSLMKHSWEALGFPTPDVCTIWWLTVKLNRFYWWNTNSKSSNTQHCLCSKFPCSLYGLLGHYMSTGLRKLLTQHQQLETKHENTKECVPSLGGKFLSRRQKSDDPAPIFWGFRCISDPHQRSLYSLLPLPTTT